MNDLDTKNGKPFSAASEYLYQRRIESLEAENEKLLQALEKIIDVYESVERGDSVLMAEIAREALND